MTVAGEGALLPVLDGVLGLVDGLIDLLSGLLSGSLFRTRTGREGDSRQSNNEDERTDDLHARIMADIAPRHEEQYDAFAMRSVAPARTTAA